MELVNKASPKCRDYVLDITLASPLPREIDLEGARSSAKRWDQVQSLVDTMIECQPRVRIAYAAWLATRENPLVRNSGVENVLGTLINFGVFRRLVEEGRTQAEMQSLKTSIVFDQGLNERCDARILTAFIAEYSSGLPAGFRVVSVRKRSADEFAGADSTDKWFGESKEQFRTGADLKRAQAESQVEKIADLFRQGNDATAEQFLNELIELQTSSSSDHSHVVKSLCNIATKCVLFGRREISLKCLTQALTFPSGIDAILYLQIGNAFREIKQFDRAISCYVMAKQLNSGEKIEGIDLEIIRVEVAQGHYDKAIDLYQQIPKIEQQPQTLCSLGTLYRKMGKLPEARRIYWSVLTNEPWFHPRSRWFG